MRLRIIGLIALIALLLPSIATAQPPHGDWADEWTAITGTAATTTQTSAMIQKPPGAKGLIARLNITVGTTLLLDINMGLYSPTLDSWTDNYSSDCPTAGGGTGVGNLVCIYYPAALSGTPHGDEVVVVPTFFRFQVEHGNANAATYTLLYQWIW